MKTIRDAIKESLNLTPIEEIKTNEGVCKCGGVLPLPFPWLIRAMAFIMYVDSAQIMGREPDSAILSCLSDGFNLNSIRQSAEMGAFLQWWLEQEADIHFPDDDDDEWRAWYDLKSIADKWNKWAETENRRRMRTDG